MAPAHPFVDNSVSYYAIPVCFVIIVVLILMIICYTMMTPEEPATQLTKAEKRYLANIGTCDVVRYIVKVCAVLGGLAMAAFIISGLAIDGAKNPKGKTLYELCPDCTIFAMI